MLGRMNRAPVHKPMSSIFINSFIYHYFLRTQINIMLPVLLSVITRALVTSDNCFGGVETFEKLAGTNFEPNTVPMAGVLLQQDNVALTRDCINLCKQQQRCTTFYLDYVHFRCSAYVESSRRHREHLQESKNANLFEKICLKGISRQDFDQLCGNERLWAFERVKDMFLDGFVEKELTNMADREECAKACLMESSFICRSAEFDEVKRICRLSKENRRTQPQAFVYVKNSQRDYIENQCAPAGPASCVYTTKSNMNVFSMDSLQYASSSEDCQLQCDRESSFNCLAYGFINNRCMLSGDDEKTIGKHPLMPMKGAIYGERTCVAELCTNGIFTYEKITGHVLRSAITTPVELPEYSLLGVTSWCRESCDMAQLNCPAFTVNYKNSRCERLDRNTQGRINDLTVAEGESYFEKICLRVPQIMSQCQDKFWAFERILGYELAPILYVKTLNFVQSRRDCQEYCLQEREFPCRSALYNDETTECKLSPEDRRTSPGHYYRSRSIKINYLENQCVRIHSSCPYQRTTDAYPTYTDIVETNSIYSNEACEKLCNDNRYFLCRSYAYYSSNSQCFLSGDDSVSAGSSTSHIQHRSNIMYYERQCSKLSTFNANQSSTKDPTILPIHPIDTTGMVTEAYTIPMTPLTDRIGESSTSGPPTPDIDTTNLNKEVVIINGTVGGIITTKITRFPESLLPTLSPPTVISSPKSIYSMDGALAGNNVNNNNNNNNNNQPSSVSSLPENVDSTADDARYKNNFPSNRKCAPNARFLFEKVTSFEPIGGHLTLLYTDLQNPGIVTECARRCEHSALCRAFVIDYYHQTCHGLFENSSVGLLDLRLSMGKEYFEGFCVPNYVHCNKYWPFDRIIDQAIVGVQPEEIVRFVTRAECRTKCLEEKKFRCSSASYNSFTHECHLYSKERDSGALNLQFNKGIDFMENQCVIDVKSCRYHAIERDISIVSVTKSVRGTSTFHCEQACDYEKEFNCRSYTYLDNPDGSIAPGGNLCLLSSDNRATSHQGSIQFRPRALYAEKDCVFRKNWNHNRLNEQLSPNINRQLDLPPTTSVRPTAGFLPDQMGLIGRQADHSSETNTNINQQSINNQNQIRISQNNGSIYKDAYPKLDNIVQHVPYRCAPEEYTFEKTFGHDLRYAKRERAPIPGRSGVVNYCRSECIQRGDHCKAFTIEYGPDQNQNCYFLSEAASENRNQLNKFAGASYNEKICLREKTCNSMWAFERIIGYTMNDLPDKEYNSIMFRTACQNLCLLEKEFVCHSLTYDYGSRICRLFRNTRRSKPDSFTKTNDHVDYFENKCTKELATCQYKDYKDRYFNYVDKVLISPTLIDCQRQCDSEYSFHCKSINYDPISQECSLSSEDSTSVQNIIDDNGNQIKISNSLTNSIAIHRPGSIFSEKGNCEQVSVQCNQNDMLLTLNFDSPFFGRVYTKSNPSQCFVNGNGQLKLQFAIPLDSRCGTYQESTNSYLNEVMVQQHSVIMTDNDRTIRVLCSFEISDQTITLGNVEQQKNVPIPLNGIDVSSNSHGRSYLDRKSSATFVANTAPPPSIMMRILDHTGQDAQVVSLGDDLMLRIEVKGQNNSPYAIFARNLYARSSNGESLFLIDNNGCPIDSSIFPALRLDSNDHRSLYSKFKAFRFPSTGVVNFEVQIRFCQDYCEPVKCTQLNGHVDSFGRRRRRRSLNHFEELVQLNQPNWNVTATNTVNDHLKWSEENTTTINHVLRLDEYGPEGSHRNNNNNTLMATMSLASHADNDNDQNWIKMALFSSDEPTGLYARTRSNKTGFTYPTSNYRHYSNSNLVDGHNNESLLTTTIDYNNNNINLSTLNNDASMDKKNQLYNEIENGHFPNTNINITNQQLINSLENSNDVDQDRIYHWKSDIIWNQPLDPMISMETNHHQNRNENNLIKPDTINETKVNGKKLNGKHLAMGKRSNGNNVNVNSIVNAALPLPTSATELPLSLAIMVDDADAGGRHNRNEDEIVDKNDDDDDDDDDDENIDADDEPTRNNNKNRKNGSGNANDQLTDDDIAMDINEWNGRAENPASNTNLAIGNTNEERYRLQFADIAGPVPRADTRNAFRILNDKTKTDLNSVCADYCTNTGIIIFITTLIVTIVHLTLAASVYLYINKLKHTRKTLSYQKRMLNSLNYSQPSGHHQHAHHHHHQQQRNSITPNSTLQRTLNDCGRPDDLDFSSINDDTLTPNAAIFSMEYRDNGNRMENNYPTTSNITIADQMAKKDYEIEENTLAKSWFGIENEHDNVMDNNNENNNEEKDRKNFGSIRSSFNQDNIFYGPKEQRFFGINNYSFPSNNHNRNRTNL